MLKIGIVGCGAIGSELARAIERRFKTSAKLAYLCDSNPQAIQQLKKKLKLSAQAVSISELVRKSDFVIEAASQKAALEIVPLAIRLKKRIMVMSVGGLLKMNRTLSQVGQGLLYVPSGAVSGIDGLLASRYGKIKRVTLTTRKPLASLKDAPFFKKSKWSKKEIKKPTVIFEGSAASAIEQFPQNINVAATLSLAGIGAKRTRVRIVTSPTYTCNSHQIELEGSFGRIRTLTENVPSKANPKTSALAIYSAIACLEKIFSPFKIGT